MSRILLFLFLALLSYPIFAQNIQHLGLSDVIVLARNQSPASKQADTRKKNGYWQYRLYRSNYNPQLQLSGNIPGYNRDFLSNRLDDGTIQFQNREQISSNLNMGLNQPIAWTGGNISLNSNLNYFSDLNQNIDRYSTTLFNVQLNQPLFGFNSLKWDRRTEPLKYEESKRSFVEEMDLFRESLSGFSLITSMPRSICK